MASHIHQNSRLQEGLVACASTGRQRSVSLRPGYLKTSSVCIFALFERFVSTFFFFFKGAILGLFLFGISMKPSERTD